MLEMETVTDEFEAPGREIVSLIESMQSGTSLLLTESVVVQKRGCSPPLGRAEEARARLVMSSAALGTKQLGSSQNLRTTVVDLKCNISRWCVGSLCLVDRRVLLKDVHVSMCRV